jgi:hypothetical protein
MPPDDVVEHFADVLRLLERSEDGVDRPGPDLVTALDELDELRDYGLRLPHARLVSLQREAVAAQVDGAAEALAKGVEDAVGHSGQLGRDVVGNGEDCLGHYYASFSRTI